MYHIAEAMVRWLAPILSFTAEEIWQELPGERGDTVLLSTWHEILDPCDSEPSVDWQKIREFRPRVTGRLEDLRAKGTIGSSLDADVKIHCAGSLAATLKQLGDELRFVFITSSANVLTPSEFLPPELSGSQAVATTDIKPGVVIVTSGNDKCLRCWHKRADVGQNAEHPELCGRCVSNVDGPGEMRVFA